MVARKKKRAALRGFHGVGASVLTDSKLLLRSAGLDRDAERLRSLQVRTAAAYEAGRFAEGDRLAAKADLLVEKIDNALIALEEEGEPDQDPVVQSVTRQFAEAWHACMEDPSCRFNVNEYRRTGHGKWNPPNRVFIGPPSRWIGHRTSPEALRQAAEHPEWYRDEPGYFEEPHLVHRLRDIIGDQEVDGLLLIDAAEDAWNSMAQTTERIRAGAAKRRTTGVDPVKEAKRWVRRMTRRKKRTSRQPVPNSIKRKFARGDRVRSEAVGAGDQTYVVLGYPYASDTVVVATEDSPTTPSRQWSETVLRRVRGKMSKNRRRTSRRRSSRIWS